MIHRMPDSRSTVERYDVVDRSGRRVRTVTLPLRQRIVGFGERLVYVAVTDADDVDRLARHPWER